MDDPELCGGEDGRSSKSHRCVVSNGSDGNCDEDLSLAIELRSKEMEIRRNELPRMS